MDRYSFERYQTPFNTLKDRDKRAEIEAAVKAVKGRADRGDHGERRFFFRSGTALMWGLNRESRAWSSPVVPRMTMSPLRRATRTMPPWSTPDREVLSIEFKGALKKRPLDKERQLIPSCVCMLDGDVDQVTWLEVET